MIVTLDIPDEELTGLLSALEEAQQHLCFFKWDERQCRQGNRLGALREKLQVHALLQVGVRLDTTEVHCVRDVQLLLKTVIDIAQSKQADPLSVPSQAYWDHLVNWVEAGILITEAHESGLNGKGS